MRSIAIIEDDKDQSLILAVWLKSYGYQCEQFSDAETFLEQQDINRFELILLDWQLPGLSGLYLLKQLPAPTPPIIFITVNGKDEHIAEALHSGADDFLIKPVSKTVLLARIHAVTRRHNRLNPLIELGDKSLQISGQRVSLSGKEFQLLSILYRELGQPVSRADLTRQIWQQEPENPRSLDVLVSRLRKKLSQADNQARIEIQNLYGTGYKLVTH